MRKRRSRPGKAALPPRRYMVTEAELLYQTAIQPSIDKIAALHDMGQAAIRGLTNLL